MLIIDMNKNALPHKGGPHTQIGKATSSRNATIHGLGCKGFLNCKKDKCFYYDSCRLRYIEGIDMQCLEYNGICIQEFSEYEDILTKMSLYYGIENSDTVAITNEYALICIRCNRVNKYEAIIVEPSDWVVQLKTQLTHQKLRLTKKLRDVGYQESTPKQFGNTA